MYLDCDEIIPGKLWVGGYFHPGDAPALLTHRITTVFSLQSHEDLETCGLAIPELTRILRLQEIRLIRFPILDFDKAELERRLPDAVARLARALEPAPARVYLHCTAGINRAPTTAAAFLIRFRRMPAREAWQFLIARRRCSPYLDVLERYAEALKSSPEESEK